MREPEETDDELAARIGRILAITDPVPATVVAAARASGSWRGVDAELAVLMYDSVFDRDELAGVRGGGPRLLTFTSPDLTVELEVRSAGRGVVGQVDGPSAGRVEMCRRGASVPLETDPSGHFVSEASVSGPISIRVTDETTGTVTQTEWVVI